MAAERVISNPELFPIDRSFKSVDALARAALRAEAREKGSKPKLLALHGISSNAEITMMQFRNLGAWLSEMFDVTYVEGDVEVEPRYDVQKYSEGPFLGWTPHSSLASLPENNAESQHAVDRVMAFCRKLGPFDGAFGFSQGASLLTRVLGQDAKGEVPLDFVILAHSTYGGSVFHGTFPSRITVPSIHIIGINDDVKPISEETAKQYESGPDRLVLYHEGRHELPRDLSINVSFQARLKHGLQRFLTKSLDHVPEQPTAQRQRRWLRVPLDIESVDDDGRPAAERATRETVFGCDATELRWKAISEYTSIAPVPGQQLTRTRIDPKSHAKPSTLRGMLAAAPPGAPCLRDAAHPAHVSTYGQLLSFISPGGAADLRCLGIERGNVVVYAAPPGGSAAAAGAFLAVASQCPAAPLDSAVTAKDAAAAIAQFHSTHVIFFEGVKADGLRAAVDESNGRITAHVARFCEPDKPGLFEFVEGVVPPAQSAAAEPLHTTANDVSLLLRTSGTTSAPKGVPLKQGQVVLNALLLGGTLELTSDDICLNAMPLFHIGGLSASIMATLAVGAQVTCLGSFSAADFAAALAQEPRPTWYSAVPTIHMLVANHFRDSGEPPVHALRFIRSGAAALTTADHQRLSTTYGGIPVLGTYSMSEQMPISQPPRGLPPHVQIHEKPGSVGVPTAASLAIIDPKSLVPMPPGVAGVIAISGQTVMTNYLENPDADVANFFLLSCAGGATKDDDDWFFITGDNGVLDAEGHLTIKGRSKELIKRGGEQVSPYEIEDALVAHAWFQLAVCFVVESELWGEEPGVAIVLSPAAPTDLDPQGRVLMNAIREQIKTAGLAPYKVPAVVRIVQDSELPKTSTRKYIRGGLAKVLGVAPLTGDAGGTSKVARRGPPKVSPAISGACASSSRASSCSTTSASRRSPKGGPPSRICASSASRCLDSSRSPDFRSRSRWARRPSRT